MNNPEERPRKSFLQKYYGVFVGIFAALLIWTVCGNSLQDFWLGLGYEPSSKEVAIRDDLELTGRGERIFNATKMQLEDSNSFNQHCESHSKEISLLGCYTDGKIYVYEITNQQLIAANRVTAAHELLHAAWERMNFWERDELEDLLEAVYRENQDWFEKELEYYDEAERLEEVYTRAGTKLSDLPEELEEHYAKFFRNRGKIVQFYQEYEAPFLVLQLELEELAEKIEQVSKEIEAEREVYYNEVEALNQEIMAFNNCAGVAGCFSSEGEFTARRKAIVTRQEQIEASREKLNQKITENNERIVTYRERQAELGDLNDAMNSNIELIEIVEEES